MRKAELLTSLIILGAALFSLTGEPEKSSYRTDVVEVVDGDTVEVQGEIDATVRLLGVDTPEVSSPNNPEEYGLRDTLDNRECLSGYAEEATRFVKQQVNDTKITIRTDRTADRRGEYGRLLAYVETDSGSVNRLLLEQGLARVYESEFTELKEYQRIESEARSSGKGLWSC